MKFADFWGNENPPISSTSIFRFRWSRCPLTLYNIIPFYNAIWQLFINFYSKSSHFLEFPTLKNLDLLQNAAILRVLKNLELQIREIQNRELQGLCSCKSMDQAFKNPVFLSKMNCKLMIKAIKPC